MFALSSFDYLVQKNEHTLKGADDLVANGVVRFRRCWQSGAGHQLHKDIADGLEGAFPSTRRDS